jgi:hypothetical protein
VATEVLERRRALAWPEGRAAQVAATVAGLALLMAVSLYLRTRAIQAGFWIDEGLSVGIGSFPLTEIPGVLKQDGSPPLYYLLLHVWMDAFGTSEEATHAFSIATALATIPAAFWAGWSLFGRWAGWIGALLAACNPFLTIYAQETRMYALVILLSLVTTAFFLHAFVYRRRWYVPAFAFSLLLLVYTHNWGLFFGLGTVAALALVARDSRDRRGLLVDAALAYGAVAVLYAPWLPTLVSQAQHTGAPWSDTPSTVALTGGFMVVLAGQGAIVAIILAGLVGLKHYVQGPDTRPRTAVLATLLLAVTTLVSAWLFSQFSAAWANRYLGVLVGPTLLVAAAVLPRAGRLGLVALGLVAIFWIPYTAPTSKSNPKQLAGLFDTYVQPGDVVLSTQPEQIPVLAYYWGDEPRYATPLDADPDTRVMDWRDAVERLEAVTPEQTLDPVLDEIPVGNRLYFVYPVFGRTDQWRAPWTSLVRRRSARWRNAVATDPRFIRTQQYTPPYTGRAFRLPLAVDVYEKTDDG